jgi:wyosine [tRNA(Phe)-imidazoG37] synthetase (radical SAM superfamily)
LLRPLGKKIAVISNGSLLWQPEVRGNLKKADLVSVKIDERFSGEYHGDLVTETMLVDKFNTDAPSMTATADFIAGISPRTAYISIPTRPPTEKGVQPPGKEDIVMAYQIMKEGIPNVECLIEYEGEDFATVGDIRDEVLGILSVHPLREGAVVRLLKDAGALGRIAM